MRIKINKVSLATAEEWDEAWNNCDYATYFHSREWAEMWKVSSAGNYQPEPRLVSFSDGKKAIIPLSCHGIHFRGLIKDYISSPAWTYGGWISKDNLRAEHAKLLIDYMLTKCGNLYWLVNPHDKTILTARIKGKEDETHVLDLSGGFDKLIKKFPKWKISKAQKYGISVKIASQLNEWQDYFKIYNEARTRWGGEAGFFYNWQLFKAMHERHSPHIRLWLGIHNEKIISGAVCFYAKRHAVGWHMATLGEYLPYTPSTLLVNEIVKDACQNGYPLFDFNPSGGHQGVVVWKKSFGTRALSCPVFCIETRMFYFYKFYKKVSGFISKIGK